MADEKAKTEKRTGPTPEAARLDAVETQAMAIRLAIAATHPDTGRVIEALLRHPRSRWPTILSAVRTVRQATALRRLDAKRGK